jgi:carbonic anhydrase/acetyltransferase-like protein (isoleucine patch superfamily)
MIMDYDGTSPTLESDVFVAPNATVLGAVALGAHASVWYGAVLRGDVGSITVGARTNIQDLSVVHVTTDQFNTVLGDDVTVGHRVILHGCTLRDRILVGMGSILMDGVVVEEDSLIGAGTLLTPGTHIPSGSLVLGSPGRVVRPLRDDERDEIRRSAEHYIAVAARHRPLIEA